jgi:hypothetical protein
VLAWHRQSFQLYWRWKSRPNPVGRPKLDAEIRDLIRRMAKENPTWGRRRIRAELALLGYEVAELTVAKYYNTTRPHQSLDNNSPQPRAIATSAPPDHRAPVVRSSGPTGCPPAVWRSTVSSAPASPWGPSDLRSEEAAFGSRP